MSLPIDIKPGSEVPLAHRLRPDCLSLLEGQPELTKEDSWFAKALRQGQVFSCIFWGPPGVGKTSLARLMAAASSMPMDELSAVSAGKAQVQELIAKAKASGRQRILFLDEIHRFNKAQQDVLLPCIEDGRLILIGATTENPSFILNNALLSRCRVLPLNAITEQGLHRILHRALLFLQEQYPGFQLSDDAVQALAVMADGDARYALNALESLKVSDAQRCWDAKAVQGHWARREALYDRDGDAHYDAISALHKSLRDSDVDAALYWLARMLEAGDDPRYLLRRLIRIATEDIGLADPRALTVCLDAQRMYEVLGSPEGDQALFFAASYLALAAKSNAVYLAEKKARKLAKKTQHLPVPLLMRNASSKLAADLGHGAAYRYAHDQPDAFVDQQHFPDGMLPEALYRPNERGFEKTLQARLAWFQQRKARA